MRSYYTCKEDGYVSIRVTDEASVDKNQEIPEQEVNNLLNSIPENLRRYALRCIRCSGAHINGLDLDCLKAELLAHLDEWVSQEARQTFQAIFQHFGYDGATFGENLSDVVSELLVNPDSKPAKQIHADYERFWSWYSEQLESLLKCNSIEELSGNVSKFYDEVEDKLQNLLAKYLTGN